MLTLGIESSCDETAAAVLQNGTKILSNVVASQISVHRKYGGVVPELASRHHLENIVPVVATALEEAGITTADIDGIAVTQGPGLVGSLLVGINYAKTLSFVLKRPLAAVNHLEGHIYSAPLDLANTAKPEILGDIWQGLWPALALIVSGGHTSLFLVRNLGPASGSEQRYQLIGRTRDDAAGEAFDKVAKLVRLGYPGGPIIDRLARKGDPGAVELPIAKISDGSLDFSFSGIKTAVLRYVQSNLATEVAELRRRQSEDHFHESLPQSIYDLIASFQQTVVETLFEKTLRAAERYQLKSIMISGGVACNSALRERFVNGFSKLGVPVYFPSPSLCTDNAAMIAAAGYPKILAGKFADATLNADVSLKLA